MFDLGEKTIKTQGFADGPLFALILWNICSLPYEQIFYALRAKTGSLTN